MQAAYHDRKRLAQFNTHILLIDGYSLFLKRFNYIPCFFCTFCINSNKIIIPHTPVNISPTFNI